VAQGNAIFAQSQRSLSRYRKVARPDPGGASRRLIAALARGGAVLVLLLLDRYGIDAAEPAVEVDVGAAAAAERPESLLHRLAADRARPHSGNLGAIGHGPDMGEGAAARQRLPSHHRVEPAEADRVALAREQRGHLVERQPHHVAVGAHDLHDKPACDALRPLAAGLDPPLPGGELR